MMNTQRILHVDDSWGCRQLVNAVLSFYGYEVLEAETGAQAVAIAQQEWPDLILMDIYLPNTNGVEATKLIKASPVGHVPVIAVTSSDKMSDYKRMMDAGCSAYLLKPFSPSQLLSLVRQHLQPVPVAV
jgi:two-component system, cell cycle response regulator DivK